MSELFCPGVAALSVVHTEDNELLKMNVVEMLCGKRTFPDEFRMITKEIQTRWIMETVIAGFPESAPGMWMSWLSMQGNALVI